MFVHDLLLQAFSTGVDESTLLALLHWYQTIISNEKWSLFPLFCLFPESGAFPMNASISLMLEIIEEPNHTIPVLSTCTTILVILVNSQRRPNASLSRSSGRVVGSGYEAVESAHAPSRDHRQHGRHRRQQLAGHSDRRSAKGAFGGERNGRRRGVRSAETHILLEFLRYSLDAVLRLRWIVG